MFVRDRAPIVREASELLARRSWRDGGPISAAELATVDVSVGQAPAAPEIAIRLGVREGTPLLVRRERTTDGGETLGVVSWYFPREVAAGGPIEEPDSTTPDIYRWLDDSGHRLARFSERVSSRMPRPAEARALDVGTGTPVVLIERTAWTDDGRPVLTVDEVLAADRNELRYEVPTGERARLVTTVEQLQAAMTEVVRGAQECLVAVGSRSRDIRYLETIEKVLSERPRLVHYRILVGPPHHQGFKDHLVRLLEMRDPASREHGMQTMYMGVVDNAVREPERFFVASERGAVITLPSFNTAGYFDTGLVLDRAEDARGLVQHAKELYFASKRVETVDEAEALQVLR